MRRPSRPAPSAACVAALAGPTILAFASGGYFDTARQIALVAAWALAATAVLLGRPALPRRALPLVAIAALAAYCGWAALSTSWAPLGDVAAGDVERDLLYLGALIAAVALLRPRAAARAAEPALAAGATIVVVYGLAGRLLPGIVHEATTAAAAGRLAQPLTYWNAEGALAALALVLCTRLTGDDQRPLGVRCLAVAAAVPLALGVYLTFSRGALAALGGGLLLLVVLAPTPAQLRAIALCAIAGGVAVAAAATLGHVRDLSGSLGRRETQGAEALLVVLAAMLAAAGIQARLHAAELGGRLRRDAFALPRHAGLAAGLAAVALVVVPVTLAGGHDTATPAFGETAGRLTSLGSNRYAYWKVALRTGADHPLAGVGTGGYGVAWLRERHIDDAVHDAHSLELEAFAELGLAGLALLGAALLAVAGSARAAHRLDPRLAAGPAAALTVWALHSAIDWDWEMPALTLVAVALAGLLLARADEPAS